MTLNHNHSLLLVDDEPSITRALKRIFRLDGYEVHTVQGGAEALEWIRSAEKPPSLIISDQRMPGMTGSEFLEKSRELCPETIRFLLTGYADLEAVMEAVNKGKIHRYLTKPWNDEELRVQVRQGLEQYELVLENRRLMELTLQQNEELNRLNKTLEQRVRERTEALFNKNRELSRLNKELESNLFNTVRAFMSLTELFAPEVTRHGRRVSELARDLAGAMEFSPKASIHLELAGLVHDVGKLGLPRPVWEKKEEELKPNERALLKRHPEEGQALVSFIDRLEPVGRIIRSHHERPDGKGYPDALSGEDVPEGARVLAVVDAYDNLVQNHAGNSAWIYTFLEEHHITRHELRAEELRKKAALHQLRKNAGTAFDSAVVEAFLQLMAEKGVTLLDERHEPEKEVKEEALPVEALQPGMILSRPLYTGKGRFLLPYNTPLMGVHIEKILEIHRNDPITDPVYVRKTKALAPS